MVLLKHTCRGATPPSSPDILTFPFKASYLCGLPLACLGYRQLLAYLEQRIATNAKTFCVTLNLNILRLAHEQPLYAEALKSAELIFADGMPIVWLSRLWGRMTASIHPLPERLPGCDIVYDLCRRSHEKGYRIFMLGAAPGVAEKAKSRLEQTFPNIQIVGTYAPSPQELFQPDLNEAILARINRSSADILFVALGAPKQELWLYRNYERINPTILIPCGASIDFIAGVQKKAPRWLGRLGFEWLFRLICNPTRLFKRYILQDLPFFCRLLRQGPLASGL
jgi:N-acetylglucosaminyldiphosphoundecaprenol N-acetyl-beta-D-mannosaminyltransferase